MKCLRLSIHLKPDIILAAADKFAFNQLTVRCLQDIGKGITGNKKAGKNNGAPALQALQSARFLDLDKFKEKITEFAFYNESNPDYKVEKINVDNLLKYN